ncbi:ABC transporter permease [Paenibacillus thalictri]|uniref:ABC transporter permease n=1 Tax=Paenibacillus thalictri TaxID=2527873 RepID=A0A4Q9DZZ1_9BACL|nr:ABC transporter permease [Paenibacillus thalictri]TBL81518.1 ABC transporter permease [Paenibacillus thalictri]
METGTSTVVTQQPLFEPSRLRLPYLNALIRNKQARWAILLLIPLLLLAWLAPILPLSPPLESNVRASLHAPSLQHPFGTDKLGRDVLSRTLAGIRVSLLVGITVSVLAMAGGMLVGTLSGFFGRRVDRTVMAVVDIFLSFPSLLLAIGLVATLGAGTLPVIIAITIADLPRMIRLQRSVVLSLKSRAFIDAARIVSAPKSWLMRKHIMPNTLAPMLVAGSITAANAILTEAALSFLGLGITPPAPSLGNIIHDGQMYLQQAWWISVLPGMVILLITISLHFFSDGIRIVLDPKSRQ